MATDQQVLEHYTNLWCWRRGFKASDLGSHPCADDLVLLIRLKDELGQYISNEDHCWLNGIWGMVYKRNFTLKNKHLDRISDITIKAVRQESRHNQQMAKIKKLRHAV
jgi:hypothetical protein